VRTTLKRILLVAALMVFLSACSWITGLAVMENEMASPSSPPFTVDQEVTVTGTVIGTITDCAFDGICALVLDVDGAEVNAIWAEGMLPCEGQYEDGIAVGEVVEAFGIARDANSLSICPAPRYTLGRPGTF
jgi:hypothetical protein